MVIIRKSERKRAKLRMGISAAAKCGKTMGALLIAYGITGDWSRIGLLDTEEGSGELYTGSEEHGVKIQPYNYVLISAPYTIPKYIDALHALENCCDIVILDSITHAWAGTGGLLQKQGKIADQSKNSYTAWRFVTPEHTSFVDAMLQSPRHIIATMRSKTEYVLEPNEQGKMVPRKIGMAPIQRDGMEYEFTVVFDINYDSIARAVGDRTKLFSTIDGAGRLVKREFIITPDTGRELLNWLNTGTESLDEMCAVIAKKISIVSGDDLGALYNESSTFLARLGQEKPAYLLWIRHLFDDRAKELGLVG